LANRLIPIVLGAAVLSAALGWVFSAPNPYSDTEVAALPEGRVAQGEQVFWAGGCASCHAAPKAAEDRKLALAGGQEFKTEFGTFVAPNISQHETAGIGSWSKGDFVSALKRGVSPDGSHYYPAFPFTSYAKMTDQDASDLWAYMKTLPASATPSTPHQVSFPFNIRRGLGLWKQLYLTTDFAASVDTNNPALVRGRYLVEALAHCAECHTPRNAIGGLDTARWMAGGKNPDGKGTIPNITPHADGIKSWSEKDIAYSLESGFTPDFDSLGSTMADVVINMSKLPASDREAIAAYLASLPPHASN